ncbi:MAG TPA: hypothetical protein VM537_16525 [Anaerolineae bacterium]|nr:hypothetical protein [Anaerolineae bacterium]
MAYDDAEEKTDHLSGSKEEAYYQKGLLEGRVHIAEHVQQHLHRLFRQMERENPEEYKRLIHTVHSFPELKEPRRIPGSMPIGDVTVAGLVNGLMFSIGRPYILPRPKDGPTGSPGELRGMDEIPEVPEDLSAYGELFGGARQ